MIRRYMADASAPMFLSGFFRSPPENFHTSEFVEMDIIREDEETAIPIPDISTSPRDNEASRFVNKRYLPTILNERGTITSYDQIKRQAGEDPFQDPRYAINAANEAMRVARMCENKNRRTIELMAAQTFQTGAVTLLDTNGDTVYTVDFQAKTTHLETVGTTWALDGSTGNPIADIGDLAIVVRKDGKLNPNQLIFGQSAWRRFIANADVKAQLDNRRMEIGGVTPATRGEGATFQGFFWIGTYRFEMWTYEAYYKAPNTGTLTPYVSDDNVIMKSSESRLDLTYGAIPMIRGPQQEALAFLPSRMASAGRGLDLTINAYFDPSGTHLNIVVGTRPLTIPTAIDTIARLDVTV
jgi:hypothetical protein